MSIKDETKRASTEEQNSTKSKTKRAKRASRQKSRSTRSKRARKNHQSLIPETAISDRRLQIVIDFMRGHLQEKISVIDAGRQVKLSTSQVYRLFVDETGLTPIEYLIRLRMERAELLLSNIVLSIKEIMALTGYLNRGHFIEHFERYFGATPSEYRKGIPRS